jgi:hypothetical protein
MQAGPRDPAYHHGVTADKAGGADWLVRSCCGMRSVPVDTDGSDLADGDAAMPCLVGRGVQSGRSGQQALLGALRDQRHPLHTELVSDRRRGPLVADAVRPEAGTWRWRRGRARSPPGPAAGSRAATRAHRCPT